MYIYYIYIYAYIQRRQIRRTLSTESSCGRCIK